MYGGKEMAQVTKQTMIGELLNINENVAPILLGIGMHCLGCPSSQMETGILNSACRYSKAKAQHCCQFEEVHQSWFLWLPVS